MSPVIPAISGQDVRGRRNLAMEGQLRRLRSPKITVWGHLVLLTAGHRSVVDITSTVHPGHCPPQAVAFLRKVVLFIKISGRRPAMKSQV